MNTTLSSKREGTPVSRLPPAGEGGPKGRMRVGMFIRACTRTLTRPLRGHPLPHAGVGTRYWPLTGATGLSARSSRCEPIGFELVTSS